MVKKRKNKKKPEARGKKPGGGRALSGKSTSSKKKAVKKSPHKSKRSSGNTAAVHKPHIKKKKAYVKKRVEAPAVIEEKRQLRLRPGALEKRWVGIVCVIFLALVVYSNIYQNRFIYDDTAFIVENDSIRSLDNIGRFFGSLKSFSAKGNFFIYRPLPTLTFALDYGIWGLSPSHFHILNVLFHVLNGILVYLLANALIRNRLGALVAALVFVAHPVQVESVTWIAGRSNLMFLAFYLVSLIAYIRIHEVREGKRIKYIFILLLSFSLALLSKEMAITLPIIIIMYDFYYADRARFRNVLRNIKYYLLLGVIAGGYLYIRYTVLGRLSGQNEYIGGSLSSALLTMSRGVVYYIKLLFYPIKLSAIYVLSVSKSIFETPVVFSISIILLLLIISVVLLKRSRAASFAIMWFFVTLLPVYNIIPLQDVAIAERFLYLPSIGFCILLGLLGMKMFGMKEKEHKRNAGVVFIVLLVIFFSLKTMSRNTDWRDEESFWRATAETAPESDRVYNSLGYLSMGKDINGAIKYYEKSLRLNPDNLNAQNNLAIAYAEKGWHEKAIRKFKDVLRKDPLDSFTHNNLGHVYIRIGLYNNAIRECKKAIELNPSNSTAFIHLGLAYEKKRNYSEALNQYNIAIEKDPDNHNARAGKERVLKALYERKMRVY